MHIAAHRTSIAPAVLGSHREAQHHGCAAAGASPRLTAGNAVSASAVHAFDEGHQATVHAAPDAVAAVSTSGTVSPARPVSPGVAHATTFAAPTRAAEAGSPVMRRSLEDSASLLLLAGIGPPANATISPSTPAGSRPVADRDAEHTPALDSAHTQPAPDQALASDGCVTGHCRDGDAMASGSESAEDANPVNSSPVSSGAPARGTAELRAEDDGMLTGSRGPSPVQLQRCQGAGAQCEVRLLLSLRMITLC